ncbi:MAG: hypothetical protein QW507_00625 [Candidatus Nanoarchaeia archaeon]|nr:GILT family protein [Candidatus Haiyanarchaeum thermophilum]MCW1302914.1 GILT family protein [Candidatus Haiyanarchaeum thermophilum]MCW1307886.1 GILT family protein [Candidatus Haiyanarchaeum thermophilum]MCW1308503.1 GILT family protein [Candidatus Haiyanarchaeum thermophilum]
MMTAEEGKSQVEKKEGVGEAKIKIPKWIILIGVIAILGVLAYFLYLYLTPSVTGGAVLGRVEGAIITYLYHPNCPPEYCNVSQLRSWSEEFGVNFHSYFAEWMQGHVALLYSNDKVWIVDFSSKKNFADTICKAIGSENACRFVEENLNKTSVVNVDLFVMSYCPFGIAMENAIYPVKNLLKDKLRVRPYFILYPSCSSNDGCETREVNGINVTLWAMHGNQELYENKRQACIYKYLGENVWWEYVYCFNQNKNADTCLQRLGINVNVINACIENEGFFFLQKDQEACASYNAWGSPTVFVNGDLYTGERTPEGFKNFVCRYFIERPSECAQRLSSTSSAPSGQC